MIETCQPCKDKGRLRMPHFTFHGVQMCGDCHTEALAKEKAQPKPEPDFTGIYANMPKEDTMPKPTEIDWNKVQADRDGGATLGELAMKYQVSSATISTRTKPRKPNGAAPAVREAQQRMRRPRTVSDQELNYALVLEDLKARRHKLDLAIAAIEELTR